MTGSYVNVIRIATPHWENSMSSTILIIVIGIRKPLIGNLLINSDLIDCA